MDHELLVEEMRRLARTDPVMERAATWSAAARMVLRHFGQPDEPVIVCPLCKIPGEPRYEATRQKYGRCMNCACDVITFRTEPD